MEGNVSRSTPSHASAKDGVINADEMDHAALIDCAREDNIFVRAARY